MDLSDQPITQWNKFHMKAVATKQSLRKQMRQKRRELDHNQQDAAARGLLKNLLATRSFLNAKRVSMYFPNDGEIDPSLVLVKAIEMGKQCYYPVIFPGAKPKLYFARVTPGCSLKPDRMGILTPQVPPAQWLKPADIDLILLPLVAFDQEGSRVGMGGGFYDASLAFLTARKHLLRPKLIGIAHELQKAPQITADHWDVPLHTIVTDQNVYQVITGH